MKHNDDDKMKRQYVTIYQHMLTDIKPTHCMYMYLPWYSIFLLAYFDNLQLISHSYWLPWWFLQSPIVAQKNQILEIKGNINHLS